MKIEKSDLHLLFAPASKPAAQSQPATAPEGSGAVAPSSSLRSSSASEAAAPSRSAAAPATRADNDSSPPLLATVKAVSRTLWRKLEAEGVSSRREQRKRLLELLQWYCGKNGLQFEENARQPYVLNRARVDGRIHACIGQGDVQVALEVCFVLEHAALQKLRNAHTQGKAPLLLWAGPSASRSELLARVASLTGNPSTSWLELVLLAEPAQGPK